MAGAIIAAQSVANTNPNLNCFKIILKYLKIIITSLYFIFTITTFYFFIKF